MKRKTAKKALVTIYCKIGCDQFPVPPWMSASEDTMRPCTGDEIVAYLLSDTEYAWDEATDKPIGGDRNIWTLCTNEKMGQLTIWKNLESDEVDYEVTWRMGSHHVDKVEAFITELARREIISTEQFNTLISECRFADANFDIHYDIRDYLIAVKEGKTWSKPIGRMDGSKRFFQGVDETLKKSGFTILTDNI